ncbi:hypothetical protein [Nocardia sp. No.11]|uniref:hypothetical protein n=1 Tax=Nocardia sp. No.11 TaxID=3128861 RepID=UPI00319E9550
MSTPEPFSAALPREARDAMRDVVAIVEAAHRNDRVAIAALATYINVTEVLNAFAHLVIKVADASQLEGLRRLVDAMTAEEGHRGE